MKKVLIVEDEVSLLKILAEKFESEKFEVLQATNGEDGMKMAFEKKPDVILLDILIPGIDGLEVLETIRKDPWGKDVPIFMLTNLSGSEEISRAMNSNISGFIVKSDWKLENVIQEVKSVLQL